jgi:curved DNA-binding protein CbpA
MPSAGDPFEVLGVARGATEAQIHSAYRAAVRRTHPDAGGSAVDFEAVQEAYEILSDPGGRARLARDGAQHQRPQPAATRQADPAETGRRMDDLLAESQRLEDEARRLAGMAPRYSDPAPGEEAEDTIGAVLRDAGGQILDAADEGVRGIRKFLRRSI